ncbi:AsmA-like C-terminal region-containing protein [uncultured Mameliella sp.]|uniref:YhdP family protein n=1 Tax=uncultured Mameliella sp. TaxID=1447087 RepID=UPI002618C3AD|nr:AsmA-like C-terminal region-containing protein [uncultured Mameliella sp.]
MQEKSTSPRRRRRGRRLLYVLVALLAALGVAGYAMVGRPVDAPEWVRERIETRIAESLPGIEVDFGRMSLLVQRSGLARVILWDVEIRNLNGETVAQLSDIEAGLSPAALLNGQVDLREAQVSGAFVTLRRAADGRLGLSLGDAFAASSEMPDIGQIIARIDTVLGDPRLAGLKSFEADALTLRYEDQRARRGWTADGGRLRLAREDGRLTLSGDVALLSGGDGVATVEVEAQSPIGQQSLDFGVILHGLASRDIATQSPALAWLEELDAPISGALRSGLDDSGTLKPLEASLQIGKGALQPTAATRALPFESAETAFTYTPAEGLLRFQRIRLASPLGKVTAAGTARLNGIETGWPQGLTGQFTLSDMALAKGALLDRSVNLSGAEATFKVRLDPFEVTLGELRLTDPTYPLRASGQLSAQVDGWRLALDTQIEQTTPEQVLGFWPEDLHPGTRRWVENNVQSGRIEDVQFALRADPGADEPKTYIDFAFSEGVATFNPRMPGLTGAAGRITIYDGRLGLRLEAGTTDAGRGPIDLSGTEFVIGDLRVKPAVGEVRLQARGSVTAALSYLNNEAWRLIDKADRTVDMASGRARVSGRIALPLVKGLTLPDVALNLQGTLSDVDAPTAIPGKPLTADRLALSVTNKAVALEGAVIVDGVPATGRWARPFSGTGGEVDAEVTLTPESIAALGIGLPPGTVRGSGKGQLRIDMPRGAPARFSLTSDLVGMGLSLPQLGWDMAPGEGGRFAVAGLLGKVPTIERLELQGAGLKAEGRVLLTAQGGFDRLELTRLTVGDWLDVAGRLRGRGAGVLPAIEVGSGSVDMRGAPFTSSSGTGGGDGRPGGGAPLILTLDSLRLTDSIVLEDFRADFDTTRGLNGRFDAQLGGRTPVKGLAVPQAGGTAFRITGEDAGDVLRAAGLLKTVRDGSFQLDIAPVRGQPGSYDGFMRIEGTRLRKAPAIAALLDAVSVVGLLDQLNGPGIFFTDVEARFRLTPSRVIVSRSSAVGPSMGISLDGYYDLASGRMDMQGVLSPIYLINGIGQIFSRRGEGLIGFNFNLRGSVENPRVRVNPLSAFTPGMFRDIFRRPPPKLSQ